MKLEDVPVAPSSALTNHEEVVEKDIQGIGFTPHAYSQLAEVYSYRAKRASRELSVLHSVGRQHSSWAHHASMSQCVSMALASICSERGTPSLWLGGRAQPDIVDSDHVDPDVIDQGPRGKTDRDIVDIDGDPEHPFHGPAEDEETWQQR